MMGHDRNIDTILDLQISHNADGAGGVGSASALG
jgi:hypothetical protein